MLDCHRLILQFVDFLYQHIIFSSVFNLTLLLCSFICKGFWSEADFNRERHFTIEFIHLL